MGGQNSSLFGLRGVRTVACGSMHTIMLPKDNALWSCGKGSAPGLGTTDGQAPDSLYPTLVDRTLFHNHPVVAVGAGATHPAVVTAQGRVYAWGQGRRFQQWATGVGTNTTEPQWRPHLITLDLVTGIRAGRWHKMPKKISWLCHGHAPPPG